MKKILLIEDNNDVRENTAEILELSNYVVVTAEDGKKGVEMAIKEHPDLIVCDIMMPVLDGYGVLHLLSKNKETAAIPFIFLTAKTERSDLRKGMEMGADDYVTKPFEEVELLNAIESRLKKNETFRKDFESSLQGVNEFLDEVRSLKDVKLESDSREIKTYKKREVIYELDRRPQYLFLINKGKVKISKQNEDGKEFITQVLTDGDFFGYAALIEEKMYDNRAEALEDSDIMLIPKHDFSALINGDIDISRKFIKLLADNLSDKEDQLLQLAYNSVRKRVADALLLLNERYRKSSADKPLFQITREDLARIVGTATESLIRTLSDFRSEKLIEIKESKIQVLDEDKLRKLIN